MKPNFALNILPEGLELLHRATPGWERIGSVRFEAADLPAELAALRRMGEAFDSSQPMRCKLVIPNEQIRYMSIYTGATTEAERREIVLANLDGATPYALDQLQFCWSVSGSMTHVAAVAEETLAEAEAFAMEHGFNPVSFVAIPEGGGFIGEPFFGPTEAAATLLDGAAVVRDAVQIHVLGNAALPAGALPQDIGIALPDPGRDQAPQDEAQTGETQTGETQSGETQPEDALSEEALSEEPLSDEAEAAFEPGISPEPTGPEPIDEDPADHSAGEDRDDTTRDAASADEDAPAKADAAAAPEDDSQLSEAPLPAEDGGAASLSEEPEARTFPPAEDAPLVDFRSRRDLFDLDPAPTTDADPEAASVAAKAPETADVSSGKTSDDDAEAPPPAFQTVRRPQSAETGELGPSEAEAALRASLDSLRPVEGDGTPPRRKRGKRKAADTGIARDAAERVKPRRATPPELRASDEPIIIADKADANGRDRSPSRRKSLAAPPLAAPPPAAPSLSAPSRGAAKADSGKAAGSEAPPAAAPAPSPAERRAREAERMTVFGARAGEVHAPARRSSRRLLVAALVLACLGAAGWAAFGGNLMSGLSDEAPRDSDPVEVAESSTPRPAPIAPEAPLSQPLPEDPEPAPEAATIVAAEPALPEPDLAVPLTAASPSEIRPAPATPAEAAARYAATGIWQRAPAAPVPPMSTELGEIDLAALTPTERAAPVVGLEDTQRSRPVPGFQSPSDPPAPGLEFELDPRGYVAATPDGALTPDGHLAFLGAPPVTPPSRPRATLGTEAQTAALPAEQPAPDSAAEDGIDGDRGVAALALSALEAAQPPSEDDPESEPAPGEEVTLAAAGSIRPRARPEGLVPEAPAASDPDLTAGVSSRPRARPEDFEILVAAAQAAGIRPPELVVPAPTVAAPGPSQPSVARLATVSNALDLKRISLIGVSGEPSAREALVRLADGRIRKVAVGDRLDGGRVAAIGDGELRYVKNNRSILLNMPD